MCVLCLVSLQFLDFFLKGNLSLEPHPRRKPHDWLPRQGWQDLMKLTELAAAKGQGGTQPDVNTFDQLLVQLCACCRLQLAKFSALSTRLLTQNCRLPATCCNTGERHALASVADDIASNGEAWRAFYELEAPESAPLPGSYSSRLSQFEVLLLLRCLRVDRVVVGITHFVIQTLGDRYVTPPVLDYNAIFRQSSPTTPVVFVLSPGADPAFDVFR